MSGAWRLPASGVRALLAALPLLLLATPASRAWLSAARRLRPPVR